MPEQPPLGFSRAPAVELSVSDVRRAIYAAAGFRGDQGQASTQVLGSLFHSVFRHLLDSSSEHHWSAALDSESLGDHERLRRHVYQNLIGPALQQNAGALQSSSAEVLALWTATEHLCRFVCQFLVNSQQQGLLRFDASRFEWAGVSQFSLERELRWQVDQPGWAAPVEVKGIADAVWQHPVTKRWCVMEVKLGQGSGEADRAQLCLYYEMLRHGAALAGQLSLFHFQPELQLESYSEEQTRPVKDKLVALIGKLAGVSNARIRETPVASEAHRELGRRLVRVLEQFGPMVTLDSDPVVGPAFLRFHIRPQAGVKVNQIVPLGKDLGLQLGLSKPALIQMEEGSLIVDLERKDRETLFFREFQDRLPQDEKGNPKMLVGVDLNRQPRLADLSSETPHILAAGTTGSGKSEWLLSAIASLIATNSPQTLKLVLIDPKRVTFRELQKSPYLLNRGAVLVTSEEALDGIERLYDLMEQRYQQLEQHGVNDLASLRTKLPDADLPRIVCFCDEYGNLVESDKKLGIVIESKVRQIGAKARAAGIHLVIATQDPRAEILSPALKSNLDGRVCLRTASAIQSRMILETNGGEALLGRGDLIFKTISGMTRLQAPLLSDTDRASLFGRG